MNEYEHQKRFGYYAIFSCEQLGRHLKQVARCIKPGEESRLLLSTEPAAPSPRCEDINNKTSFSFFSNTETHSKCDKHLETPSSKQKILGRSRPH